MSAGSNLRKIRDSKKLSQQDVADYLGVERETYMNWEAGISEVKGSYFPKLADFFDVEISDFFQERDIQ